MSSNKPQIYLTVEILNIETDEWEAIAEYPLENLCVLLGRKKDLSSRDIRITASMCNIDVLCRISGVHLTFYRRPPNDKDRYQVVSGYAVRDGHHTKPSRNGTLLNGKPLKTKTNLIDGDILQIGKSIRVVYHQFSLRNKEEQMEDTMASEVKAKSDIKTELELY